jgi:glycosyltransferase involved in cell wall biosynthesis
MKVDLAVIIPCFNEEKNIGKCLDALLKQNNGALKGKIVVVDNGSNDGSIEKIKQYLADVKLYILPNDIISGLRNYGVEKTRSVWLAFIDADVEVSDGWLDAIMTRISILDQQAEAGNTLFGSTVKNPINATWIEQTWYEQLNERGKTTSPRYINSGHLVISRTLFNRVGGFDIEYETGEDVKLCDDVRSIGGQIFHDSALEAIHHGYPKSLGAFFKRERWHGRGMKTRILTPWQSRPLLLSLYNLLCLTLFIVTFIFWGHRVFALCIFLIATVAPLVPLAIRRGTKSFQKIRLLFLYFVYGWARTMALVDIMNKRVLK